MSDYTIDWSHTNVDGNNTIHGPDGDIHVSVATPKNGEGKQWFVENGMLKNWDVTHDSSADITFSEEVTNVSFTLLDVDRLDEVTIMTKDADGNPVPVEFEVTGVHDVNGNVVTGTQTTADGPSATNNQQDIDITIAGPLKTFWIVLDDGPERSYSGTVAVSDIHFDIADVLDGTVEGTDGDDIIDVAYTGDPDGDMVDNNDAILPGDAGDDDLIFGYEGDDSIEAGDGDDEVYGGSDDDEIDGGAGDDVIYGDTGNGAGGVSFDGTQDFNELSAGDLIGDQYVSDGLTITSANANNPVMVFDTSNPTGHDYDLATTNLGNVLILSEDGDSNDPDDNAHGGTFNITFDSPAEVSGLTLLDVEAGAWIKYYDADGNQIDQVDVYTNNNGQCVVDTVVQNVSSMEVILGGSGAIDNLSYTLSGDGIDDGLDGDDIIDGGAGDDLIFGEGGDDTIEGGAGDDVIYGDSGAAAASTVRETLDWAQQTEHEVDTTFVQDTGNVDVTFTRTTDAGHHDSFLTHEAVNVDGLDGVDSTGGLRSETNGQAGVGEFQWEFSEPVTNVAFNINDIDGDGVVEVRAFDAAGNEIPVDLTGGQNLTLVDSDGDGDVDTADSNGGYQNTTSPNYNLQVSIPGPVARIVVEHTQDGVNNSGIVFTDMEFDALDGVVEEGGDDVITGGAGADEMFGEDGNDTFIVSSADEGAGDVIDGGNGPDQTTDLDVLDLTGAGRVTINDAADANDDGATAGTVTFDDGTSLTFEGIEQIITDPQNEAPTANDDIIDLDEDGDVTFDPTGNDVDPDGDDLTVVDITEPANGELVDNGDGTYTYVPDENFNGTDSVTYTIEDPSGEQSTATVTFNVAPVNDDPEANDDVITTSEDEPITIPVLGNDSDPDGDDLTVTEATSPDGEVTINPDGTITFTPDENFNGETTITYTVDDGNGGTDTATVTVNVTPIDELEAVDDTAATDEDTPVTIDVVANDLNEDGGEPTIIDASVPADQGSVEIVGNELVFTPAPNFNGEATITYTIEDEDGLTDDAEVTVNVAPVNDDPIAGDDSVETDEDTPVTIPVLDNDTDVDGDDLTVTEATSPDGEVTINPDGTITFTPDENFNGETTITYTVDDGNGGTDTATVTVNVTSVDELEAVDDTAATDEDTPVTIDVVANDLNEDGGEPTIIDASVPADQGSVEIVGNELVFTPAPNFNGEATITYTIEDEDGLTDDAEVTVNVAPVNDAPEANTDSDTTDEDTSVVVDLLANDSDVDGDTLTVVEATVPAEQGTLVDNGDGTVTFTPAPDFNGEATISYTIEDEEGLQDSSTHVITVEAVGDAPEAEDDVAETDEDTPVTIDVLGNDSDPDGDALTVTEATSPDGEVTINPDGTIEFSPAPNFEGETTISYTVTDPDGNEDTATVTVTVNPVNDAPEAITDTDTTGFNEPITVDLLENDFDVDGDDLTVIEATVPADQGTLVDNGDGTVRFTPAAGFVGTATISYTIEDAEGLQASSTHLIVVESGILDGTVEGTDGDDLIDGSYMGDPEGDMVDNNDAILPGDVEDDDLIYGFGGDDSIIAGAGDDEVFGGEGDDTIAGKGGSDTLSGDEGNDTITGGQDNDTIFGGDDNDVLDGDSGDDSIEGGEGDDSILGGGGDDVLGGGSGDDTIDGENNDDMIFGGAGDDVIDGGTGDDKIEGGSGNDTIIGDLGDDDLWGASGDDSIDGGRGNDSIGAGDGNDVVDGGDGNDTIDTSGHAPLPDLSFGDLIPADGGTFVLPDGTVVVTSPDDDLDTVFGGAGNDTITTGDDADSIDGGEGADVIDGGIDADTIEGGDGDDTIIGGEGSDSISGGEGNDTIFAGIEPGTTVIPGIPGAPFIEEQILDAVDPEPDNGDDLVFGGAGNDTIFGADDSDELYGDEGDDFIDGEIDDDELFGGDGNDTLEGGQGDDVLKGEADDDTLLGEEGNDTLFGGDGNDDLDGGEGDDFLAGGAGDDVVEGGDGDDLVAGNDGDDVVFGGDGDDTVTGGLGEDQLTGGEGADEINGGLNSDTIFGGNGGDVVIGGEDPDDSDVDVLDLTGSSVDFVTYEDDDPEAGTVTFLDGSTMTFSEIENVIPCFTPGTTIATPKGERLVEELREGDRIITRDNGIQEIRWVGRKEMSGKALMSNPHLKPVLIRAGALGNGLPERDMLVSPNHRCLVASDKTQLYFEESEVLAAAKHLVGSEGIFNVDVMGTSYIHFMFDRHEVVLSNGAWTESFQPGDYSLKGLGNGQRNEIFELFPELQTKSGLGAYETARRALKKHEARLLIK